MEAGIVGFPNVGKSTLYNALTTAGVPDENYPFCTIEPNVGMVTVPDDRLDLIQKHVQTKKVTPATLRLLDIAGLVTGASHGEGLGNKFLSHIRNVDAILHLVRCFQDDQVAHVSGDVDPVRDVETIDTELMLADLEHVQAAVDKAARQAKGGDKEAGDRAELLELCRERLERGQAIRGMALDDAQRKRLKGLGMLTAKPVLWVANVDEENLLGQSTSLQTLRQLAEREAGSLVSVCAKLESELSELEEPDRREMLDGLGLAEPVLPRLIHATYALLGLRTFFTTRSAELRAWTVPSGAKAPEAAGVIHTDMERGFIRVEIYGVADLEQCRSERAIRDAGRLRIEGKDYVIQDGDVCHFLFNV